MNYESDVTEQYPDRLGATTTADGSAIDVVVWAPESRVVEIDVTGRGVFAMAAGDHGYHRLSSDVLAIGDRYGFRLDGGPVLPDPASRSQPDGVLGLSEIIDTSPVEPLAGWRGVDLRELVIYELHVGTFTPEGTFTAVIAHLDRLRELGITAIELMPIAAFPGRRNWGYDGVFPFAAQYSYGGRAGLVTLVAAAHARGMAILLDVVHNHVGPEGNRLAEFGPYFDERSATPWGGAVNMSGPGSDEVRRFFLESLLDWLRDVGVDGFRLDAVHAIVDQTAATYLEQLSTTVHAEGRRQNRTMLVIAESSDNDPRLVLPVDQRGVGCDAVWNDDYHHGIRVALTGERTGYYVDYRGVADVAQCLERGWVFDGRYSVARGRRHGRPASHVFPEQLVVFAQNHDQIGNRAQGDRLDVDVGPEQRKLAAAATLLTQFTPMIFMGEEYGERAPFPYFVDHDDAALIEAVRRGRRAEFPQFADDELPDPAAPATFERAVLDPTVRDTEPYASVERLFTDLLALRRSLPSLTDPAAFCEVRTQGPTVVQIRVLGAETTVLVLHFGESPWSLDLKALELPPLQMPSPGRSDPALTNRWPWEWRIDTAWSRYGGPMSEPTPADGRDPDAVAAGDEDVAAVDVAAVDVAEISPWSASLFVSPGTASRSSLEEREG